MTSTTDIELPNHLRRAEIDLSELGDSQLRASLAGLLLSRAAWSCFSLSETSRLLRPLQIRPEITGTHVLTPDATSEITYKFQMSNGHIGMMSGMISIEDFRGDKVRSIYEQLNIGELIDLFMDFTVVQIIDHLRPIVIREDDERLWKETLIFRPQDLRHEDFLIRGLRLEAIPRAFRPHLNAIHRKVRQVSRLPNVAFQLCLRAYLEYNEIGNRELISILLSKYFYSVYRHGGIMEDDLGPLLDKPTYGGVPTSERRLRLRALSRLLTIDNDSDTTLEEAGLGRGALGGAYDSFVDGPVVALSAEELQRLRQDAEWARQQADEATQVVAQYQEGERTELLKRLGDPEKFLQYSVAQFFEDIMGCLPHGVQSEFGAIWIPRTSSIDERKRHEITQHLRRISDETYLFNISSTEATIIGYWRSLAASFYNQCVLSQYKKLNEYSIRLEEAGITIVSQDRFTEEVQLRFATRHHEIVTQSTPQIANLVVNGLAQRVAINTSQQTYWAMRDKLADVLQMEISQNDVKETRTLINTFVESFMGRREELPSPYPVGTILEVQDELNSWVRTGKTLIGQEIMSQLYREYIDS